MRKGILILRPPTATQERQAEAHKVLAGAGWTCELRERFDGVLIVAFDRDEGGEEPTEDQVRELLAEAGVWADEDSELRTLV